MHCLKQKLTMCYETYNIYRSKMYDAISSSKDESDALGIDHCKVCIREMS